MLHKNFSQTTIIWLYFISPSLHVHKHIHTHGRVSCCSQIPSSQLQHICHVRPCQQQAQAAPCTTSPTALLWKKGVSQGTCRLWAIFNSHKHTKFKTQLTSNSGVVGLRSKYFLHFGKKMNHCRC